MRRCFALTLAAALLTASLSACVSLSGGGQKKQVDLAAFARTVQENHGFPGFLERVDPYDEGMGEQMARILDRDYPGLTGLEPEQMEIYMGMVSFSGGELALVQAKNTDDAAAVEAIFQARIDAKTADGRGNYPDEIEMWQRNAAVASNGCYVMLVNHKDSAAIVSEFHDLFK